MFQPGEEGHHGARFMLEDGLLATAADGAEPVSMAFAIHQTPTIPSGMVASRGQALMASADELQITVRGRGGHASMPHHAGDPIPIACEIVTALQAMVTRRVDAFDPAVVTVAKIRAGSTTNVIPETATLWGTIRTVSEHTRTAVMADIERLATGIASAHGASAEVELTPGYPVTVNHDDAATFALETAALLLGEGAGHRDAHARDGSRGLELRAPGGERRHGVPRHPAGWRGRPRRRAQPLQPDGARRGRHGGRHRHLRRRGPQVAEPLTTVMVPATGSTST